MSLITEQIKALKEHADYMQEIGHLFTASIIRHAAETIEQLAAKVRAENSESQPCPNAISRSDMLDAIGHGTTYTSEELQKIIKALPPVNPLAKDYNTVYYTPQAKTGHWIEKDEFYGDTYYDCSECGESWTTIEGTPWNIGMKYCPNCGARMVDPQESEEV